MRIIHIVLTKSFSLEVIIMKRFLSVVLTISVFALCSCTVKKADTFDSKAIDNGYNNYLAGGKMAYKDNNLYVNFVADNYKTFGIYRFNNSGATQVLTDNANIGDNIVECPVFYQIDNKIYVPEDDGFAVYNETEDKLIESSLDASFDYFFCDLKISWKDGSMTVSYKDNPKYTIKESVYDFYVSGNKIYIINDDGWLYCNDATKGNSKSTFLNYLTESYVNFIYVCADKVFFDFSAADYDEYETGLYCYSIAEDKFSLVLKGEVNCLNSYGDTLYIATDKGISMYYSDEVTEITNRSAKEIYLLDEDWIYAVQNDAGNVYRVSLDGKTVETIDFLSNMHS